MAPDATLNERLWLQCEFGWPSSFADRVACGHYFVWTYGFCLLRAVQWSVWIVGVVSSLCTVAWLIRCTAHCVMDAADSALVISSWRWCEQSVSSLWIFCQQYWTPLQANVWSPAATDLVQTHWFWGTVFLLNLCCSPKRVSVWVMAHAGISLLMPDPTLHFAVQLLFLIWSVWALLQELWPGCNIKLTRGVIMLTSTYGCAVLHAFHVLVASRSMVSVVANGLACIGGLNVAWCAVDVLFHWGMWPMLQQAWANAQAGFRRLATLVVTVIMQLALYLAILFLIGQIPLLALAIIVCLKLTIVGGTLAHDRPLCEKPACWFTSTLKTRGCRVSLQVGF